MADKGARWFRYTIKLRRLISLKDVKKEVGRIRKVTTPLENHSLVRHYLVAAPATLVLGLAVLAAYGATFDKFLPFVALFVAAFYISFGCFHLNRNVPAYTRYLWELRFLPLWPWRVFHRRNYPKT